MSPIDENHLSLLSQRIDRLEGQVDSGFSGIHAKLDGMIAARSNDSSNFTSADSTLSNRIAYLEMWNKGMITALLGSWGGIVFLLTYCREWILAKLGIKV